MARSFFSFRWVGVFGVFAMVGLVYADDTAALTVVAQQHAEIPLMLKILSTGQESEQVGSLVKKALEFNGQCAVTMELSCAIPNAQEFMALSKKSYMYVITLALNDHSIEWRIFDVSWPEHITNRGKRIMKRGRALRGWAYAVADSLYESLWGEPGIFSTKIAYVLEVPQKNGRHFTRICMADYDGSNSEIVVDTATVNVSPRWNNDPNRPLIFYSENTATNMRMLAVDMRKKRIVASNFDGLNMLPTFSADGSSVIYCATRGSGSCQLYQWKNKTIKRLTHNDGNNFSPVFADDETQKVYFNSDFETGKPLIYSYDLGSGAIERITPTGFCVSPAYCSRTKKLVYAKKVEGVMQLFSYDVASKIHTQLTHDAAHKEEAAWSPCGSYLLCSVVEGRNKRIALYMVATNTYHYVTESSAQCTAASWSPVFTEYPVLG